MIQQIKIKGLICKRKILSRHNHTHCEQESLGFNFSFDKTTPKRNITKGFDQAFCVNRASKKSGLRKTKLVTSKFTLC